MIRKKDISHEVRNGCHVFWAIIDGFRVEYMSSDIPAIALSKALKYFNDKTKGVER